MYSPGEITDTSLPHSSLLGKECEFFKWCDQLKKEDTIDRPICMCESGLCRIDGDFFVCPIKRGQGACSFKLSFEDSSKQADETNSSSQSTLKKEDIIVRPICECEAGPCRIDGNFFVCPIKRGQGACNFKISFEDSSKSKRMEQIVLRARL